MSRIPAGMYIPGKSFLHRLDPLAKLIGLIILLAAVIAASSPGGYLLLILFIGVLLALSGLPFKLAIAPLRRTYLFFAVIFLMNALFFADVDPLWTWWIFSLSRTGLIQGANVVLRLAIIIIAGHILISTTSPMEITAAFRRLLKPLQYINIPVDIVALIVSVAIHFIPVLAEEVEMIRKAQMVRGARFDSARLRDRAASLLPLVIPVFVSAFKRADELALAMEARGYRGEGRRVSGPEIAFQARDFGALVITLAICASEILVL
jgi:energy-coupling factor transport system permease protein